jgi:hypothetical protein
MSWEFGPVGSPAGMLASLDQRSLSLADPAVGYLRLRSAGDYLEQRQTLRLSHRAARTGSPGPTKTGGLGVRFPRGAPVLLVRAIAGRSPNSTT